MTPPGERTCVNGGAWRLGELLSEQDRVIDTAAALDVLTRGAFRWRVESGKWQRSCRGVAVAHSGPLAESEILWTTILWAGVQQRLVRVEDLISVVERNTRLRRRKVIVDALNDIRGGAHALSELDFTRQVVRRFGLPEPDRQAARRDSRGRRRWLDAVWERAKVIAEVDGAAHLDTLAYWDDMSRDNDFRLDGYQVMRFPAFMARYQPEEVARTIREALREAGCAY